MTRAELEAIWDGHLVLMTRRAGLLDLSRRFDITWFVGAIHKYRRLLGEVLVASFFLQLFALVSPLFFQVVIDKVLVHRSLSTLDVLIIGLVAISVFETVLGILRTYLFAHTTNRIDVELGARLFRHLVALPIAYFQARRVGDSVARVRELENIRNFLTSSALTLVIDLFFTFVFVAVMFFYSPLLTGVVLAAFPFYIAISAAATPLFRRRLDEKFKRGAENQAFLVESVTGIETLKAMAVEPQMQRRWEEQLAGYVAASFRVTSLGNTSSQVVQLVSKLVIAAILYFGALLVIDGSLTVGELVAFNMLAGRVSAPVLRLAQIWQDFHQARLSVARLGDILNTTPEADLQSDPRRAAGDPRRRHVRACHVPLPDRRRRGAARRQSGRAGRPGRRHRRPLGLGQEHASPSWSSVSTCRKAGACWSTASISRWSTPPGCAVRSASSCRRTSSSTARCARTSRWPTRRCRWSRSSPRQRSPAPTSSSSSCRTATTPSSASAAAACRAGSASASPSPARWSTDPRILIFDEATSALDYESERVIQQNMRQHRQGADRLHHRPPPVDGAHRRSDHHHRPRTRGRGRHARRTDQDGRPLRHALPPPGWPPWRPLRTVVAFRPKAADRARRGARLPAGGARGRRDAAIAGRPRHRAPRSPCSSAWPLPGPAGARSTSSPPPRAGSFPAATSSSSSPSRPA